MPIPPPGAIISAFVDRFLERCQTEVTYILTVHAGSAVLVKFAA
jgi:hypothetical protein